MTTRTLGDRYELSELIAKGGMGSVYSARDKRLNREVAVKLLKDELSEDVRFIERFKREARSAAALSHGNVARVFDYGVEDGHHFIIMELAEGKDLARILRDEGALSPERAQVITAQIAAALGHAHQMGLIHRDVKPANVIIDDQDGVKVTDFGIARAAGESTLTATGTLLGTAQYLAPEQASGEKLTPATDVYGLGIVLYEMLTGSVPFTGGSALEVAMRHVKDEVPPPGELNPRVPQNLDRVVRRATQKDPARRYADGNEFAAALGAAFPAATAPLGAPTATAPLPVMARRWNARTLGRAVLLVFGVLLALAAVLAAMRIAAGPEEEPADEPAAPGQEEAAPEPEIQGYLMPNVIGMDRKDAEEQIKDEIEEGDFDVKVEKEEVDSGEPKDTVVRSNPDPGSEVQSGGTITLYVSEGEDEDEDEEDDDDDRGRGGGQGRGKDKKGDDD